MPQTLVYHRFSVDDYEQMLDAGILGEEDRVELIRGEIIDKTAIGDLHAARVNRLSLTLTINYARVAIVSVQNPIRLDDSEPEPDVSVLAPRDDFYATDKPRPADVFLLIEVSDTSLEFDRGMKLPVCAQAGIREFWIVNLVEGTLEVHRGPTGDGRYRDVLVLRPGDLVEIAALAGVRLAVADIL